MKHIVYIILGLSVLSCDNDRCTYTLGERDYNLIPYRQNDTIVVTRVNKITNEQSQEEFIIGKSELSVIDNEGSLGKPLCKGTFEKYFLNINSNDGSFIEKCGIEMFNASGRLSFNCGFKFDYGYLSFDMQPFEQKGSTFYDRNTVYYSQKTIDGKNYEEVFLMKKNSTLKDSLYYSSKSGLIKLLYKEGIVHFALK